jgi:glycosyltransferase involved in cell wall biosynthesis
MTTPKLVTVGLPIWKRLEYLPHVLKIVEAQDYPSIELLVSDNGMNGTKVRDAVEANYSRPFTFRQNSSIVEATEHFNQIVHQASGEYFVILRDDDEITPTPFQWAKAAFEMPFLPAYYRQVAAVLLHSVRARLTTISRGADASA